MKEKGTTRGCILLIAVVLMGSVIMPGVSALSPQWVQPELKIDESSEPEILNGELSPAEGKNLYSIPVGAIIQHSSDGITRVFTPEGTQIVSAIDADSKKVPVPSAGLLPVTHVHRVPSGSDIITQNNMTKVYKDEVCILTVLGYGNTGKELPYPSYEGWIEQANNWSIDEIAQFIAYWDVPSSPSSQSDSVIFLFNAIEPSNGQGIVQPVLEWNRHAYRDWTGAAWFVPYQQEGYYSEPIDVDVGDTIKGTLGWNPGLSQWNIIFKNEDSGISTMNWSGCVGYQNNAVFCALEGYYVDGDSEVPGDTTFYDMRLKDLNLQNVEFDWEEDIDDVAEGYLSGLDVQIYSDSMVTLHTAN